MKLIKNLNNFVLSNIVFFKKFNILFLTFFLLSIFSLNINVQSAIFLPKDGNSSGTIEIKQEDTLKKNCNSYRNINDCPGENVYATGQKIEVKENLAKDVIVAGQDIEIKTNQIGRSLILAGQNIKIEVNRVGGATRIAGQKIFLSGTFSEEVIVAGQEIELKNAVILGDLVLNGQKITLDKTLVNGNLYANYDILEDKNDIRKNVNGEIKLNKIVDTKFSQNLWMIFATQFSVVIALIILYLLLKKKNWLILKDISFKSENRIGMDMLLGFGLVILPLPILFLSFLLQIYPLVFILTVIIYNLLILTSFYFPIYIANLVNNVFKIKLNFAYLLILVYLSITTLSLIPFVNILFGIIFFIFLLSNFGYLLRKIYSKLMFEEKE